MINVSKEKAITLLNETCRLKLSTFTQRAFHTIDPGASYLHNWHIDAIAEYLTACYNRDIKRLIINIPPRYMKSISVTVAWPAWLLGRNPDEKILAASYSQQLSTKHSLDCRHLIQSKWYNDVFPNVILSKDENQKTRFETTEKGHRIATSVGGSSTGEGGNILIVDDPHNPMQAASEVQRLTALTWFDQTFSSRLNNKKDGVIVVVMQRLHTNDLTGHLKEKGGWEHLCLPAIAEKKQIIHIGNFYKERNENEVLHPEREGLKELSIVKKELGSYAFSGQYQQLPSPLGGGIFKDIWWKYFEILPKIKYSLIIADTAMKTGEMNDYSVFMCICMGEDKNAYIIDILRGKWEAPQLKTQFVAFYNKHKANSNIKLRNAAIEDKASGTGLIQSIKQESKIPVKAIKRDTKDKVTRAMSVAPYVESGYVYLPKNATWLSDFTSEASGFPNAPHDDQVDVLSDALDQLYNKKQEFNIRVINV
jgi:predicted phage terminase large subunit-like protein